MRKQHEVDRWLAAEQAEQAKIDAENADALMKAEIEAKKAEVTEKTSIISDPRVDKFEKSVEEIKADQKEFKEALKQQAESQEETKSMLDMILQELRKPKP